MEEDLLTLDGILDSLNQDEGSPNGNEGNDNHDNGGEERNEDEFNEDDLINEFSGDPESVVEDDDIHQSEKAPKASGKQKGDSPTSRTAWSSAASMFAEEGVFTDVDDDEIENCKSAEDLVNLMRSQIDKLRSDEDRKIADAFKAGVPTNEITETQQALQFLNGINEEQIEDEKNGYELRSRLIFQDYLNLYNGDRKRAEAATKRAFDSGDDIALAKEALESNKNFFTTRFNKMVDDAKSRRKADQEKIEKDAETLRKSILEDDDFFGLKIDKRVRGNIYNNIARTSEQDADGNNVTPLQKYQREHPLEFAKYFGLFFTLTDGFKSIDKLVKGKVKQEMKEKTREFERMINSSERPSGNMRYASGEVDEDSGYSGIFELA